MNLSRIVSTISVVALLALIVGAFQQQQSAGYHKLSFVLSGGVPATLYYQDPPGQAPSGVQSILLPPPPGQLRAGVVLAHGFAFDRHMMTALAESLVAAGYTVMAIDLSGHGQNRNAYALTEPGPMARDVSEAVQWLTQHAWMEPSRIAVLGHSMGAMAALDYGFHHPEIGGLVMLSGGAPEPGTARPRNALFLYAGIELPFIPPLERAVVTKLAQTDPIEEGRTYGDFASGTAVRIVRIASASHGSIVNAPAALAEIVNWLDGITGTAARDKPPAPVRSPVGAPLLWISFFLVLPGLGLALARLAPEVPSGGAQARWPSLGLLALALLLPLAFITAGGPGVLAGLSLADANVTHLALAGVILVVSLIALGRFPVPFVRLTMSLLLAALAWLTVIVLLTPTAARLHGVWLTPEKALLAFWTTLCLAPFALALQWLSYRPQWWRGALLRLAARLVVIFSIAAGLALGVFDFGGAFTIFALVAALLIVEPVLAGFYGRSRNLVTAAGFDAIVTAWLLALLLPSSF